MSGSTNRWVLAAWLAVVTTSLSACVDERAFYIVQNQVPEQGCVIPGTETEVYRPFGLLDLRGRKGYTLFPLVQNDLPPTAAIDDQPERNKLRMLRFNVELDLGQSTGGAPVPGELTRFSVPTSAILDPGALRSSAVMLIKDALIDFMFVQDDLVRPTVTAKVEAVAEHAGDELKSAEFTYTIEICDGCLVTLLPSCPAGDEDTVTIAENVCGLPQDGAVTCCNEPTRGLVCLRGGSE